MLKPRKVVEHPAAIVVTVFPEPFSYLSLYCLWKLLCKSSARLADVAVPLSDWLADKFRLVRCLGDDGVGIATAFLKGHVEQHAAKNREFSLAPHCILY